MRHESWGRYFHYRHHIKNLQWRSEPVDFSGPEACFLPYGLGRSYGDSCLNDGGTLLDVSGLHRFIAFDATAGLLRCEAGVRLRDILNLTVPKGWFLPVSPGTQFVTVGGAIANDVHGKNHHRDGTFGRHVTCFELLRSSGERLVCSPTQNEALYRATIGGLGLTGIILWAEIYLKKIAGPRILQESIKFSDVDEFFTLSAESDEKFEYTVSWIDPSSRGDRLGRGLFLRGNHETDPTEEGRFSIQSPKFSLPLDLPNATMNRWTIGLFNELYFQKQTKTVVEKKVSLESFFYPLDALGSWNRIYGKRGFFQYQCVLPYEGDSKPLREILGVIAKSDINSFLTVLKMFGDIASPGLLSFPKKGVTLAIDFPNVGEPVLALMERLDAMVRECGGRVYPAKDARMSRASFQSFFPQWEEMLPWKDPKFSSSFWRRVT